MRPTISQEVIDKLGLTSEMVGEFNASAISGDMLLKAGIFVIRDAKAAAKLLGKKREQWEDGRLPVWVKPYHIPGQRDPVRFRGKPAKPFEVKDEKTGKLSVQKYAEAWKSHVYPYFNATDLDSLEDATIPLFLTEGGKKAMCAGSHGLTCIAFSGVTQWHLKGERTLHPAFARWTKLRDREVFLCFDADSISNSQVRKQEIELGRALETCGAIVRIVRFPASAPKLDDFLATHELSEFHQLVDDARKHGQLPPDETLPTDEEWTELWPALQLDVKTSFPTKDLPNIMTILARHPRWSHCIATDVRRQRQVFISKPPFRADLVRDDAKYPRAVTDSDASLIADWMSSQKCLRWWPAPKVTLIEQAIAVVAQLNGFDPVREYLEALQWDRVGRVDSAASTYFGAPDTAYSRVVLAKWLLSAVARALTPGVQADHVLILEGPQGIGKSSALKLLAGEDHFSDSLPPIGTKDALEHLLGPWIVELAELSAFNKTEVNALKQFATVRTDRFRAPYARRTLEHPRRCVIAGTTNETTYLRDPTGGRRWWALECTSIDLAALARDRDMLWAECVVRVRNGERWHIDDAALAKEVSREQEQRRQTHPWEERVTAYVAGQAFVTVTDILTNVIKLPLSQQTQREANTVVAILGQLGWAKTRASAPPRQWGYRRGDVRVSQETRTGSRTAEPAETKDNVLLSNSVLLSKEKQSSNRDSSAEREGDRVRANGAPLDNPDNPDNPDRATPLTPFSTDELARIPRGAGYAQSEGEWLF